MSRMALQQPDRGFQDKYVLKGEGFVWPVFRSMLVFMGLLPVWVTFAMLILEDSGTQGRFFCPILSPKWDKRTVPVSHSLRKAADLPQR